MDPMVAAKGPNTQHEGSNANLQLIEAHRNLRVQSGWIKELANFPKKPGPNKALSKGPWWLIVPQYG